MKKFFKAFGKALLYLGAYLGSQVIVSFGISFLIGLVISFKLIAENGNVNMVQYMLEYNQALSQGIYYILIVSGIVNIFIYWIVMLIRKKKLTKELSLKKMNPVAIVPIFFGGISLNFLLSFLITMIPFPESLWASYEASSSELLGGAGIAMWIATVIAAPVVEEIVFRGFVYSRLKTGMPMWLAIVLTSFAFGCAHGTIIWFTYTFIFSLVLIFVLERTKSLWSSILLHMAFNIVGAATSTWTGFFEELNEIAVLAGSIVVAIASAVWFILLTKRNKEEILPETIEIANDVQMN